MGGNDLDHARAGGARETGPVSGHGRALTREQAAAVIGLSPHTLAQMGRYGRGPRFFRDGRRVFYREADVADWLAEQREVKWSW